LEFARLRAGVAIGLKLSVVSSKKAFDNRLFGEFCITFEEAGREVFNDSNLFDDGGLGLVKPCDLFDDNGRGVDAFCDLIDNLSRELD
jgi:hypothetical protein